MKCPQRIAGPFNLPKEDEWCSDHTCSYCGSLSPEKFFESIEAGFELIPTDKNYKVYVQTEFNQGKFYFEHLSVEERKKFVDLLNEKKVKLAYPGWFYVLPFFISQ